MVRKLEIDGSVRESSTADAIDVGFVGCGSHAFRNVYPTLQFADVDLVATCDLVAEKAAAYAEQFGADAHYTDYEAMYEAEDLDAVLIVLNLDEEGRPLYPRLAIDAMRAGLDVWIEKPPAASTDEIERMRDVETETGRFVAVGFKKCFTPPVEKAAEIVDREEFGTLDTIAIRYPLSLPDQDRSFPIEHDPSLVGLLDVVHPGCVLSHLGGSFESAWHQVGPGGGGVVTVRFESGALGTLHLTPGQSGSSPVERIEVVGSGANLVIENGIELTYYRPSEGPAYGTSPSYLVEEETAPLTWKPEFSLGQLYNKNLFLLGYYGEIQHFAECVRNGTAPETADLEMALDVIGLYETFLQGEETLVSL